MNPVLLNNSSVSTVLLLFFLQKKLYETYYMIHIILYGIYKYMKWKMNTNSWIDLLDMVSNGDTKKIL